MFRRRRRTGLRFFRTLVSGAVALFNPELITGLRQYLFKSVTPTSSTIADERGGLGTDRMQQPGRAYSFDGVDDLILYTSSDIGTVYISYYDVDGSSVVDTSLTHSGSGYSFQPAAVKVHNLKLWSDNTATAGQKSSTSYETIPTNLLAWYKCDDVHSSVAYDSSGNASDGTKTNITPSSFHYEGNDVPYSFQNEVGFTDDGGDLIPRDESNVANDVAGNPLEFSGKSPMKATLIQSARPTFEGINDYVDASSAFIPAIDDAWEVEFYCLVDAISNDKFFSWGSTSSPNPIFTMGTGVTGISKFRAFMRNDIGTILLNIETDGDVADGEVHHVRMNHDGAGEIRIYIDGVLDTNGSHTLTDVASAATLNSFGIGCLIRTSVTNQLDGSMWDVKVRSAIDFGTLENHYPLQEGGGTFAFDVQGGATGTYQNLNVVSFWANTQDISHYNLLNGFSLYEHASTQPIRVPYTLAGASQVTTQTGYTLTHDSPAGPYHNGAETKIDFTGGVAAPGTSGWETAWSFVASRTNPLFRRKLTTGGEDYRADRFLAYDDTLSGTELTDVNTFTSDETV